MADRTNKRFTLEEFIKVLPMLQGPRPEAVENGKAVGLNKHSVCVLRSILGYAKEGPKRMEKKTAEEISMRLKKGQSAPSIAKELGLKESAVYQVGRRRNGTCNICHDFWDEFKVMKLVDAVNKGMDNQQVADLLGCTYSAAASMKRHLIKNDRTMWQGAVKKCGGFRLNSQTMKFKEMYDRQ